MTSKDIMAWFENYDRSKKHTKTPQNNNKNNNKNRKVNPFGFGFASQYLF